MKAIAAVAISRSFSIKENVAAGITVSACVMALSITGLLSWFGRVVPIPVVKGIQVGAGLSLILSGGTSLLAKLEWLGPTWTDNYIWALVGFFFLLASTAFSAPYTRLRIPYALITVVLGLVLAALQMSGSHDPTTGPAIWHPHIYIPGASAFKVSLSASLGQLPLTTLNSIIAVSHLSAELLPDLPAPSPTTLGISVATMNLVSCWFGGMPACHGSGGLAGQYRFGARSGASIIMLGLVKLILGLFVGDALISILQHFPKSLLGIMVIAAGIELAKVGESLNHGATDLWESSMSASDGEGVLMKKQRHLSEDERRARWGVMLVTVAGLLAFRNDAVGFIAGLLWHFGLQAPDRFSRWRTRRSWMAQEQSDNRDEERHTLIRND